MIQFKNWRQKEGKIFPVPNYQFHNEFQKYLILHYDWKKKTFGMIKGKLIFIRIQFELIDFENEKFEQIYEETEALLNDFNN